MRFPTRPSLAFCAAFALGACGGGGDDDPAPDGGGPVEPTNGAITEPGSNPNTDQSSGAFDGTFLFACRLFDPEVPEDGYEVTTLTIMGGRYDGRSLFYSDAACAVPSDQGGAAELTEIGTIAYPGGTTETSLGTAMHIDLTPTEFLGDGQPFSAAQVSLLESVGAFTTQYTLFLLDGAELYVGDDADAPFPDVPAARDTTLQPVPAIRQ